MQYKIVDVTSPQYKEEMQRLQSLRTQVVLWLVVLALGVLLFPLMLISGWLRNDLARLETQLFTVQSALNSVTAPSEEVIRISTEVANIEQLVTSMQTVTIPSGVKWPMAIDALIRYDAAEIKLNTLTQSSNKLQISGRATSNDAVVRYQQSLLDAGAFGDVVVVSMSTSPPPPIVEGAPTSAPTGTAPSGAATGGTATDPSSALVDLPFGNVEFTIDLTLNLTLDNTSKSVTP